MLCYQCSFDYYRPQRSCGLGNVFTGVCLSTGGRVSASVHAGMPDPPGPGRLPQTRQTPWDQADPSRPGRHPPGTRMTPPQDQADTPLGPGRQPPRTRQTPQDQADPPGPGRHPPGKQTPAYGLRAAGTHPTGMDSCLSKHA